MANEVSSSTDILSALKTYYGDQVVQNLLFRNSPVLKMIRKMKIGGKQYPLPMVYSRGGAVSADYTKAAALATQNFGAREMNITPGQLFAPFVIDPKEYLSSRTSQGAYMSLLALKAFTALEGLRKTLAKCLYGSGYLEMGKVTAIDAGRLIFSVDTSTAMGLDIGSQVAFSTAPNAAPRSGTVCQISNIDDNGSSVTITVTALYPAAVIIGDYVVLDGGRDSNGKPNAPVGLGEWLPSYFNRTGASWGSYIATAFFGVDRSLYPTRMAGSYILRNSGSSEKYSSAVNRLIQCVRRNGGVPDLIILNDADWGTIVDELQASRNYWQSINTSPAKADKNEIVSGVSKLAFSFSTNFMDYVIDDPYCPKGLGYVLERDAVMFLGLSNTDAIIDDRGSSGNDPGAPSAAGESEPSTNYQFMIDDYYNTKPVSTASGTGIQVDFNLYGNFAINAPAHCGVVQF